MRSAERISRTVEEYHDYQQRQRQACLREALAMLRRAREHGEEWYRWIAEGRPELTPDEYEKAGGRFGKRRRA